MSVIETKTKSFENQKTLLVLAAGMGSRYGGVKQIDSVGIHGECLLDYSVFDARQSGFSNVVFIIRKDIEKDFRERLFNRIAQNIDASYVFQSQESLLTDFEIKNTKERTKPWGTLHAVLCAKEKIQNAPFAVINSDDYYGRNAFEQLGRFLSATTNDSTEHAMVGYILGNTISRNGTVSRGVCTLKNDYLDAIVENTQIGYEGNEIISYVNGEKIKMSGKEPVSMNLFGFSPSVLGIFEEYWANFKTVNINDLKAEAFLPVAATSIIKSGRGSIKFLQSTEKWFGMTYPEDREFVKNEIAKKIESGYYPEKLWDK